MSALYLGYLYDALAQPHGICILTDDPERLRQRLYAIRAANAPTFEDLAFIISPTNPTDQLWIVKKHQPKPEGLDL